MQAIDLASIAGVILSLALAYIPGLSAWYALKDSNAKAGIMAILLIVVALGIFGLGCVKLAGDFGLAVACDKSSAISLIKILVSALIANQGTYMLGVRPFKK